MTDNAAFGGTRDQKMPALYNPILRETPNGCYSHVSVQKG